MWWASPGAVRTPPQKEDAMHPRFSRRSLMATTSGVVLVPGFTARAVAQGTAPAASPAATPAFATLDDLLAAAVDHGVPGIALAVELSGETIFSGAAGVASLENQTPVQVTDRFRIYSITKTFTAIVVLQLIDEGVLTLDDTVAQWLDDPAVGRIPNVEAVTLRHLLNHTSGIYDFADDTDSPFWQDAFLGPDVDWAKVWTLDEVLAYADADNHAPYFAPGEGYHYSNTDYLLLGMIVEKAVGGPFSDELKRRILDPLGLKDTFLAEGGEMPEGTIDGYQVIEGEFANVSVSNLSWVWVAGAIVSTTADLMRFAEAVFTGELLSPESFEVMFTFVGSDKPGFGEGMGLYRAPSANGELVGMDGGGPGFTSYMMHHPDADVTVVVLANWAPDDGTIYELREEAFAWALARS
jgi:CubicO group peptidase (beta-lactamase class C family)